MSGMRLVSATPVPAESGSVVRASDSSVHSLLQPMLQHMDNCIRPLTRMLGILSTMSLMSCAGFS